MTGTNVEVVPIIHGTPVRGNLLLLKRDSIQIGGHRNVCRRIALRALRVLDHNLPFVRGRVPAHLASDIRRHALRQLEWSRAGRRFQLLFAGSLVGCTRLVGCTLSHQRHDPTLYEIDGRLVKLQRVSASGVYSRNIEVAQIDL